MCVVGHGCYTYLYEPELYGCCDWSIAEPRAMPTWNKGVLLLAACRHIQPITGETAMLPDAVRIYEDATQFSKHHTKNNIDRNWSIGHPNKFSFSVVFETAVCKTDIAYYVIYSVSYYVSIMIKKMYCNIN